MLSLQGTMIAENVIGWKMIYLFAPVSAISVMGTNTNQAKRSITSKNNPRIIQSTMILFLRLNYQWPSALPMMGITVVNDLDHEAICWIGWFA